MPHVRELLGALLLVGILVVLYEWRQTKPEEHELAAAAAAAVSCASDKETDATMETLTKELAASKRQVQRLKQVRIFGCLSHVHAWSTGEAVSSDKAV